MRKAALGSIVVDSSDGRTPLVFVVSCFPFKSRRSDHHSWFEGKMGMRMYLNQSTETERRGLHGRFHVSNGQV